MPLMERIIFDHFLLKDHQAQVDQITTLRFLRVNEIEESRTKARGITKSAVKNLIKRGKTVVDPTEALRKLLAANPAIAAKLAQQLNN